MPRRGSIAAPPEPQWAELEGTDVTHPGSSAEGSGAPVPEDAPVHVDVMGSAPGRSRSSHRRSRTMRRVLFTLILLLVLVAAAVVWVGVDALKARGELQAAATQVHVLQGQVEKGDARVPRSH